MENALFQRYITMTLESLTAPDPVNVFAWMRRGTVKIDVRFQRTVDE